MTLTNMADERGPRPAGGSQPAAIALRRVHKNFGAVQAVKDIDLDISSGEIVAFLGPNGAGKTSTIDIILGLSQPTAGTAEVFGMEPRQAITRGLVSAVLQTGGLLKDFTVRETAEYTASLFAQPRPVDEALNRAGITGIGDRLVGKCSGGEQQRLRFAMALLSDPELLILDEPTTGMDVEGRRGFWGAIRQDTARGRTVLFATHYLEEADANATRIIVVNHGRVIADGTPAQIKAFTATRTLRFSTPAPDPSELLKLPGVTDVVVNGDAVSVRTSDADDTLPALYALGRLIKAMEVGGGGLEEALIALTSADNGGAVTERVS
jgi:ABC-2 type transport system ATP-binding protein